MATEAGDVTVPESVYRDVRDPAIITGGCFVLVALVLSIFLILQHLRYYTKPAVRLPCSAFLMYYCKIKITDIR